MKSFIAPAYTFTPGASGVGTVDLSGISGFDKKFLVSIINQTSGIIIYSTASDTLKYTNVTGTTVTLFKDTSAMSSGDILQVIYEEQTSVLPTGASTSALQTTGNASLASIDSKLTNPLPVSGSVLISNFPATQPVSATTLPLPTGASTSAKQDTGNNTLSSIETKLTTLNDKDFSTSAKQDTGNTTLSSIEIKLATLNAKDFATSAKQDTSNTTLSTISGKLPATLTGLPDRDTAAQPIIVKGQNLFRTTFANTITNSADSAFWTLLQTGTGQTINQIAGNLVVTSGTTINSETIIRSNQTFKGNLELKWSTILSQRIANNNFYVELVDLIGDALSFTINSATSVTVTIPSNPFTSVSVGQSLIMQQITGAAGIPGRYAIASVAGNAVTFTVAGFPASGSGTMSLVGWNYVRAIYTGATLTALTIETQRRGYNSNSSFAATINTTASPGHLGSIAIEDGQVSLLDQLQAAATALTLTRRAEIVQSLPEENTAMYLQIKCLNGTVAPATTSTWTIGMTSVVSRVVQNVAVNSVSAMSQNSTIPVAVLNSPSVVISSGTVTTVGSVTSAQLAIPGLIADVASAALITTTTTATLTPTFGISYQVNVPVTVVSGTNPTLDITIEESDDTGTNWYKVYDFPRITATGIYRSPHIPFFGNRIRYVQTVGGTTPSFTRAINRLQSSYPALPVRQLVDRTIVLTTLNSTTPILLARDCGNATQLIVSVGAITTTAPAVQLEGSDDFGNTWYAIGTPLTAVASSTVQVTVQTLNAAALRARVSTAGVGVTANYVMIKAHD